MLVPRPGTAPGRLAAGHLVDDVIGRAPERLDGVDGPHGGHPLLVGLLPLAAAMMPPGRVTAGARGVAPAGRSERTNGTPLQSAATTRMASSVAAGGTGRLSWNGSTSLACSRLRSSEALTGIVSPRMVRSFLTASAWASLTTKAPSHRCNR